MEEKKKESESIRQHKLMGNLIRSGAKWINEGEKPTSYFLNLENRNFTNKVIPKLTRIENNKHIEITKQTEILSEVEHFYKTLYTPQSLSEKNIDPHAFLKDYNVPKVNSHDSVHLEGKILYSETLSVLKNMANNKSPGSDGFTAEFFKVFWKNIGHFIVHSLNHGYEIGELSCTQKQGIITCIPKEGKSKFHLSNWRPISLLYVIYKIGSGCIAQRIKHIFLKL